MRRSHLILLVAAVFICTLSLGSAFAGDKKAEKAYRLKVGAGFYSTSTDDSKTNVAEYDDTGGSPTGLFGYTGSFGKNFIDLNGRYTTSDDNAGDLDLDISRVVRFKVNYNKFVHRTDPLFADIQLGSLIINPDVNTRGKNYYITRQLSQMSAKVTVPSFPALTFHGGWRNEIRHGWRQGTLMRGNCTPCHIVGYGNRIDQSTNDLSVGATLKVKAVVVDYTYTNRDFNNDAKPQITQVMHYDDVTEYPVVFGSGLGASNADDIRILIPDLKKKTHVVKAHTALPGETTAYGSFVYSTMEDDFNNLDVDQQIYNLRLTRDFMKHRLTVSARGRYININSDNVNLSGDFDTIRKSAIDRDETTVNLDAAFRLNRCTTIRAGYEYDDTDRDNFAVSGSGDTKTKTHTVKLAVSGHPNVKWKYRVGYTYKNIDNPFTNVGLVTDPSGNYYDGSNQPESSHEIKLTATYMPKTNLSLNGLFKYQRQNNDHSNWDLDRYMAGVNLWFMPMKKLSFSLGYNYQYEDDSSRIYILGDPYTDPVMASSNDYEIKNHVLYLSALFTPIKRASLTLDASYTKSKANYDAVRLSGPPAGFTTWNVPAPAGFAAQTTDFSGFNDYSALDTSRFECSLGCSIHLYKALDLDGVVTYRKYTDDEPYLYDADGTLWIFNVGLSYTF